MILYLQARQLIGVTIEDVLCCCCKSIDLSRVTLANNAVVAAGSVVKVDIPEWKLASGNPAKPICDVRILRMPSNPKEKAYPWA